MYRFRHALLREVVHDDLLPGERAELHLALARALERRAGARRRGVWVTAGIAHHYRSAGDQPAALRASVRRPPPPPACTPTARPPRLLERALEVWDRVPDAEALAGAIARRAAGARRRRAPLQRRRPPALRAAAPGARPSSTRTREPRRVAEVLGELAGAQWALGRGEDSRATLRRALVAAARATTTAGAGRAAQPPGHVPDAPGPLRRGARRGRGGDRGRPRGRRDRAHRTGAQPPRRVAVRARRGGGRARRDRRGAATSRARPARRSTRRSSPPTSPTRCTGPAAAARAWPSRSRPTRRSRAGSRAGPGWRCSAPRSRSRSGSGTPPRRTCPNAAASPARRWPTSTSCAPRCCSARGDTARPGRCSRSAASLLALSLEPQFLAGCGCAACRARAPRGQPHGRARRRRGGDRPDRVLQRGRRAPGRGRQRRRGASRPTPPSGPATSATPRRSACAACARR